MKPNKPNKEPAGRSFGSLEIEQIERLLRFMTENNLEEFEYSRGDLRIRLRKPSGSGPGQHGTRAAEAPGTSRAASGGTGAPAPGGEGAEAQDAENLHIVKSPIVGTYYQAASPEAEPFVKVGSQVETGQTLCIVEAMKLMNEIESDVSGVVVRIFVENGHPVEYGQALFGIRPGRKR